MLYLFTVYYVLKAGDCAVFSMKCYLHIIIIISFKFVYEQYENKYSIIFIESFVDFFVFHIIFYSLILDYFIYVAINYVLLHTVYFQI